MLTINDLSANKELDRTAMTAIAGGEGYSVPMREKRPSGTFIFSAPRYDLSSDLVYQSQVGVLLQSNNWGGTNVGDVYQSQDANA